MLKKFGVVRQSVAWKQYSSLRKYLSNKRFRSKASQIKGEINPKRDYLSRNVRLGYEAVARA